MHDEMSEFVSSMHHLLQSTLMLERDETTHVRVGAESDTSTVTESVLNGPFVNDSLHSCLSYST